MKVWLFALQSVFFTNTPHFCRSVSPVEKHSKPGKVQDYPCAKCLKMRQQTQFERVKGPHYSIYGQRKEALT